MPSSETCAVSTRRSQVATRFCQAVIVLAVGALILGVLKHDWLMVSRSTAGEMYPMPIYGIVAAEDPPAPMLRGASGPDYSQIFTAALALRHGQSAYSPRDRRYADRWGRPPGMPPFTNWINVPLTYLPYGKALMVHTVGSILGLFAASAVLLWKARLLRHLGRVFLALGGLFFLTPIGVTHLERGQSDLLVATAALLCLTVGLTAGRQFGLGAMAGLLGAMKLTSAPFLGCYSALGFLLGTRRRRWAFFLIPVIMGLVTVSFWQGIKEYWHTISVYEINAHRWGLSMQHVVSRPVSRVLPVLATLALVALTYVRARTPVQRGRAFVSVSAPFALALMNLSVCYNTLSYEYHSVMLLGVLPAVVVWAENVPWVSSRVKGFTCAVLVILLAIAFRVYGLSGLLSEQRITYAYAITAVIFWLTSAYIAAVEVW